MHEERKGDSPYAFPSIASFYPSVKQNIATYARTYAMVRCPTPYALGPIPYVIPYFFSKVRMPSSTLWKTPAMVSILEAATSTPTKSD